MKIAEVSIRRPVFITSLVLLMLATGFISLLRLPVEQFPNVTMPFIAVTIIYPGAGPSEIETLVAKPLEEEVRTIPGVKKVMSFSSEGSSFVWAEFALEADANYCEQQMRSKVSIARARMPKGIEEPIVERYSFADQPVVTFAVMGKGTPSEVYEVADRTIKPNLEQVDKVSTIKIYGGNKREIKVLLDRKKLESYELSVSQVAQALELGGENIPLGKRPETKNKNKEWIYRSLGEFNTLSSVQSVIVKFLGNDIPVRLADIGQVIDTFKDETTRAYLNGKPTLIMEVYRQSGANTVAVASDVKKKLKVLDEILKKDYPDVKITVLRDGAKPIRDNILDVAESIIIGILLCVVVVYFFLGNVRSTLITSVALPNSLIGAFLFVSLAGFSVNMLTLLALSLAVGLLIDDAIVVRENIFRHIQLGKPPRKAALEGTAEVGLAVIATTMAILSVFGPIAFIQGITGKFLKEFGLTVCFIMCISLFDALTVGPMLSAMFYGKRKESGTSLYQRMLNATLRPLVDGFERVQEKLKDVYGRVARWTVSNPGKVLLGSFILFAVSCTFMAFIPKTFLPTPDQGEMLITLELPPGSSLEATQEVADRMDSIIRKNKEVEFSTLIVGNDSGDPTEASSFVQLVPASKRRLRTSQVKQKLREQLAGFSEYKVKIRDYDIMFGGTRPFYMNLVSGDADLLEKTAQKILDIMKKNPVFLEPDLNYRPGKPELRLVYDQARTKLFGVSTVMAGAEVRGQIEGMTPAKFRERGEEWDIRVRLRDEDRDLKKSFHQVLVPNMNYRLVNLDQVSKLVPKEGPSTIYRQNGQRMIALSADLGGNAGIGDLMGWMANEMKTKKLLPPGVTYLYEGQGEQFKEMSENMTLAVVLAVLFIFLVLASLYESFLTPLYLLLPLPLAVTGAFMALWIGGQSLNIYSIIATIMLLGIATKNSILLVDYTNQLIAKGKKLTDALVEAGRTRLRPILMTSMTLIAGTLPVAIGLNEASKQRASMGWVIIGGVISSTLLTLVVIPAALSFFRKGRKKPAV